MANEAPIGADPAQTAPPAASAGSTGGQTPSAEPTTFDVSDDTLIRVKGSDKPVKFGEHVRGFQSQFTKASQKAAELQRQLEARDQRIKEIEAAQQQAQRGQADQDVFAELRQLPYLSGSDAVEVVQSIGQQIHQRDMVLMAALKKIEGLERVVGGLNQNHSLGAFDNKIKSWLSDWGYPPEAENLAKEIYLAYEGDDLDQEFPQIFQSRWAEIEKIVEARRQAKINAARKQPFVPGRGGETRPSKPLEMKGDLSPRDVADQLWEQLHQSGT